MTTSNTMRVLEMFAGVGGFRKGLEDADAEYFKIVWANQWEPSRRSQDAFDCYTKNFSTGIHSNEDIANVPSDVFTALKPDLIVGGFPCQDYSVARSLSGEQGIRGKKGVLFWEIKRVLQNAEPKYVLLENVDRLLSSPSKQRGRDFAVMLATFRDLGYSVEWRVINAAEYGFAQRRRRVFIFAYRENTAHSKNTARFTESELIFERGFFAPPFPISGEVYRERISTTELPQDIVSISEEFTFHFYNSGVMRNGSIFTIHSIPITTDAIPLSEIIMDESEVDEKFYLTEETIERFNYLRGPKRVTRTSSTGFTYTFSEGGMSLTDSLSLPGRTMLTSEGTKNRSTHIIEVNNRRRFLTPLECERLNGFPDNWTDFMSDRMRYFCMGNALVVGLVEIMGKRLIEIESTQLISGNNRYERSN